MLLCASHQMMGFDKPSVVTCYNLTNCPEDLLSGPCGPVQIVFDLSFCCTRWVGTTFNYHSYQYGDVTQLPAQMFNHVAWCPSNQPICFL